MKPEQTYEAIQNQHESFFGTREELIEAVRVSMLWNIAEESGLGTFHDRMELCNQSQWLLAKVCGLPHEKEYKGVPRIIVTIER